MIKGKYIIVEVLHCELGILFNEIIDHGQVANSFHKILGAGKFSVGDDGKFQVYGASTTLELESKPEDAEILQHSFKSDLY